MITVQVMISRLTLQFCSKDIMINKIMFLLGVWPIRRSHHLIHTNLWNYKESILGNSRARQNEHQLHIILVNHGSRLLTITDLMGLIPNSVYPSHLSYLPNGKNMASFLHTSGIWVQEHGIFPGVGIVPS